MSISKFDHWSNLDVSPILNQNLQTIHQSIGSQSVIFHSKMWPVDHKKKGFLRRFVQHVRLMGA